MNYWEQLSEALLNPSDKCVSANNPKIKNIMHGSDCSKFERKDWIDMALSSIDQANIPTGVQDKIEKILRQFIDNDKPQAGDAGIGQSDT